jgi:hypothetical protein
LIEHLWASLADARVVAPNFYTSFDDVMKVQAKPIKPDVSIVGEAARREGNMLVEEHADETAVMIEWRDHEYSRFSRLRRRLVTLHRSQRRAYCKTFMQMI